MYFVYRQIIQNNINRLGKYFWKRNWRIKNNIYFNFHFSQLWKEVCILSCLWWWWGWSGIIIPLKVSSFNPFLNSTLESVQDTLLGQKELIWMCCSAFCLYKCVSLSVNLEFWLKTFWRPFAYSNWFFHASQSSYLSLYAMQWRELNCEAEKKANGAYYVIHTSSSMRSRNGSR